MFLIENSFLCRIVINVGDGGAAWHDGGTRAIPTLRSGAGGSMASGALVIEHDHTTIAIHGAVPTKTGSLRAR